MGVCRPGTVADGEPGALVSLYIGQLYHWSPKRNRLEIIRQGLLACKPCRNGGPESGYAYVCLGTTPSSAWGLVLEPEVEEEWDLWQVTIRDGDPLSIRGEFSPYVREVRVLGSLPADRVWWVGERGVYAHESLGRKAAAEPKRKRRALTAAGEVYYSPRQ